MLRKIICFFEHHQYMDYKLGCIHCGKYDRERFMRYILRVANPLFYKENNIVDFQAEREKRRNGEKIQ